MRSHRSEKASVKAEYGVCTPGFWKNFPAQKYAPSPLQIFSLSDSTKAVLPVPLAPWTNMTFDLFALMVESNASRSCKDSSVRPHRGRAVGFCSHCDSRSSSTALTVPVNVDRSCKSLTKRLFMLDGAFDMRILLFRLFEVVVGILNHVDAECRPSFCLCMCTPRATDMSKSQ